MANGALAQQTFEAYAAFILDQHSNILAHSTLRPFAGNVEAFGDGASEDDGMRGDWDHIYPTPLPHCRQHLLPQTMSHPKPFSPLTPIITPTLHDNPRTNLVLWKIAINRAARGVFAEWDAFGFLFGVCDDAVWAVLNTPPGGQLRVRPDFPAPP